MNRRSIVRRRVFHVAAALLSAPCVALLGSGCSSKKAGGKSRSGRKDNRDPTRFGSMLMDSYITDLKKGPASKQVTAAQELANMGAKAKPALPLLEKLTKSSDASVSGAAKTAIAAIKKAK